MRTHRIIVIGLLAFFTAESSAAPATQPAGPTLRVQCDPRVELMSIVFRLAGNPEYAKGAVKSYADDVEKHFGVLRSHPAIQLAGRLRSTRGISYDAVMSMAVHIMDTQAIGERVPFEPLPADLDARWTPDEARQFLAKLRQFVKDSDFNGFFRAHQPLYELTATRFRELLEKQAHLEWFDAFFGPRAGSDFVAVPALLNGGNCYGVRCRLKDQSEQLFCVLGVWQTDDAGRPTFDREMIETVVHEFTHSYTNPLVDRHADELKSAGERIFPYVEDAMRAQAYGEWKTVMFESMVRACSIRYTLKFDGTAAGQRAIRHHEDRSFLWIRPLSDLLGQYEKNRKEYATLEPFMPKVVAFFNDYAPRFEREQKAKKARSPRVLSITPTSGAKNVDPSLKTIRVVFDRPMHDKTWSVVGGGPHYPETPGKPSYDKACKVFTMPVSLKPNWDYEFWLNRNKFTAFASREGAPLESVHVTFTTGAESKTPP